jgi:competence protein ComEC
MGCGPATQNSGDNPFTLAVVDVGQGLSQIATCNKKAVVFDLGDTQGVSGWQQSYKDLAMPGIEAIVISHHHRDHLGAAAMLPLSLDFSGLVITSQYEDTSFIRQSFGVWENRIRFRTMGQGDTLGSLPGILISCTWPPKQGVVWNSNSADTNRYSLCFKITHGNCSVFLAADIDTLAEQKLSALYNYSLASDIIVVPHHGSAYSVDPVFYGFVNPGTAVISCGINNGYGFPSQRILDMLFQMRVTEYETDRQGTVMAVSNGEYFTIR